MSSREKPGARPRIEVRTYVVDPDGKLEELSCYPMDYYGGCPNVGDTILTNSYDEQSVTVYSVQRRYFVQETIVHAGWALILREVEPLGPPRQLWDE